MTEYKPFSKISGAGFTICNNNFYNLFDVLQDFYEKLEELKGKIQELNEQLKNLDVTPKNFKKRVKIKIELLKKRMQLQYYNNIFINKFLKEEQKIIEKEGKNIEKEEMEELLELQTKVINKFKHLFIFFKKKEEQEKELEEQILSNVKE